MPGLFPLGIDPTSGSSSSGGGIAGSMLLTPHTVTVYPQTAQKTGDVRTRPLEGVGVTVFCQITPDVAGTAFNRIGQELNNPHSLLCNVADYAKFTPNCRVVWTYLTITQTFRVEGEPEAHLGDGKGTVNYVRAQLEKIDWGV